MKKMIPVALASLVASLAGVSVAQAANTVVPAAPVAEPTAMSWPSLGGHVGLAMPLFNLGSHSTGIGADFFSLGISTGITLKLDAKWSVDFEMIGYNEFKATPAATSFVIDPGILYNCGPVVVGARIATQIGGGMTTNIGIVPIVVAPFTISRRLSYFVEADVPINFAAKEQLDGRGGSGIASSVGLQLQTGLGF